MVGLTETHKKILNYLEESGESSSEVVADFLKKSVKKTNVILGDLEKTNNMYVSVRYEKSKQLWSITPTGIEYLQRLELHSFEEQQTKTNEKQTSLIRISIIIGILSFSITSIVGGYNIFFQHKELGLIDQNMNLIKMQLESISPLRAKIEIEPTDSNQLMIPAWDLAKINMYEDGTKKVQTRTVYFNFHNIGRMHSGSITVKVSSNITYGNRYVNIPEGINGENSKEEKVEIWYKGCQWQSDYCPYDLLNSLRLDRFILGDEGDEMCDYLICDWHDIPLGWHEFKIEGSCKFCKNEDKVINTTIPFCVYNDSNSSRQVCGLR